MQASHSSMKPTHANSEVWGRPQREVSRAGHGSAFGGAGCNQGRGMARAVAHSPFERQSHTASSAPETVTGERTDVLGVDVPSSCGSLGFVWFSLSETI